MIPPGEALRHAKVYFIEASPQTREDEVEAELRVVSYSG
jgi:hypothetical protein